MADRQSPVGIIDIQQTVAAGQTVTVSGELDPFVITHVVVLGDDGATATVTKNGNTVCVAAYNLVAGTDRTNGITLNNIANASFATTDVLAIAISGAPASRILIYTRWPDIYSWTVTATIT